MNGQEASDAARTWREENKPSSCGLVSSPLYKYVLHCGRAIPKVSIFEADRSVTDKNTLLSFFLARPILLRKCLIETILCPASVNLSCRTITSLH